MSWFNRNKDVFKAPDGSRFSPAKPPSLNDIKKAEQALGFPMPAPLIEIYLKYGNGGYGPGYGVIGLAGGHMDAEGKLDVVARYDEQVLSYIGTDDVPWPRGLLPICNYGCGLYSCVMALQEKCPVYVWTCDELPELEAPPFHGLEIKLELETFENWVSSWRESETPMHAI